MDQLEKRQPTAGIASDPGKFLCGDLNDVWAREWWKLLQGTMSFLNLFIIVKWVSLVLMGELI